MSTQAQSADLDAFLTLASVKLGIDYTEEQLEFARDFTNPVRSFSFPGTGKTRSAILGLIAAELYHKVPGKNIYALSFTRMATLELRQRHEDACKKLGIRSTPVFKTLSALCREILMTHYAKLGFSSLTISESFTIAELSEFLMDTAQEQGIEINPYKVRSIIRAIRSLNSSLIFDRIHVESKIVFKKTGLTYDEFYILRKAAYELNKIMEVIQLDDIFLYTLELLIRSPEVSAELKDKIKVLLIDEFQDMSLLQLRLASLMTNNLVALGDPRQQIYAFNGACPEIVEQSRRYFPDAKEVSLTQSFRCGTNIADFSTDRIVINKMGGEEFEGRADLDGVVEKHSFYNIQMICENIHKDFVENNNVFPKNIMFIFRNNFSSIPIAEEFYKRKVPFRVNRYKPAHQIPVIRDLCSIVELCRNSKTPGQLKALKMLIPEFEKYDNYRDIPHYKLMTAKGLDFFDINYAYKNKARGEKVVDMLREVKTLLEEGSTLDTIFNKIWPLYSDYLDKIEHFLEQPASYYTSLVSPLTQTKTYTQFTQDELRKTEFIEDNIERRWGVRCYTMHAAKGTEADIVHIVDAEDGLIPNKNKIKEMLEQDCYVDAAREIRNERCLVYVSCTRAKEELHIHYKGQVSSLFTDLNEFENLDRIYDSYTPNFNDVEVFEEFFRSELPQGV